MDSKEKKRSGSQSRSRSASGTRTASGTRASSGRKSASATAAGSKAASGTRRSRTAVGGGAAQRPRSAANQKTARKRTVSRPRPEVVYTQPEPFNRKRFLLRLATVAAVVLAVFFGMSIFFKVEKVMVSGAIKYTPWEIRQASGIEDGENLLALNEAMVGGKIKTALPYVSRVRVGIKLPNTVNIEIVETDIPYAVEAGDHSWWLMASDGRLLEQVNSADAKDYTKILGVQLADPVAGAQAVALEPEPEPEPTTGETTAEGTSQPEETVPVTVYAWERLATVLDILQYLESNGILGEVASVDVSDMGQLQIWYGTRYQVQLGDNTRLSYKIETLKAAVDQLSEHYTGILDVSFTLRPSEVVYTPFD